jgi:hypothetical protein
MMVVGANNADSGTAAGAGVVYVYTKSGSGWTQQAVLAASDGAYNDNFGNVVAVLGSNTIVVGAFNHDSGRGAVYVFVKTGKSWTQQAELTAPGGVPGDYFGDSLSALSGNSFVVGSTGHNSSAGAVYVYGQSGNTWALQAELTASDATAGDMFGSSVAPDGNTIVVGADGKNSSTGAVYVFAPAGHGWTQQSEFTAAGAVPGDYFGSWVAADGNTMVVGAYGTNSGTGAAYVFAPAPGHNWSQHAELTPSDGAPNDNFGYPVAIQGQTIAVGSSGHNSNTGAAYVFTPAGHGWSQQAELTASDGAPNDYFAYSAIAFDGSDVVVGAPYAPTGGVYVFGG